MYILKVIRMVYFSNIKSRKYIYFCTKVSNKYETVVRKNALLLTKAISSHLQHAPIVLKHHCQLKTKRLSCFQILSTRMPEAPQPSVRSKEAESAPLASDQNLKTANVEQ